MRPCVTCCAHCGLAFLTDPRNAGRTDLRCPFGCRQHHHRQRASQRSTAYYRTPSGRRKKKRLNGRRGARAAEHDRPATAVTPPSPATPPPAPPTVEEPRDEVESALPLEGVVLRASRLSRSPMLPYVRLLVRLIEGLAVSRRELLELLQRALRQRSIAFRSRRDYVLAFLHQHPPEDLPT